MVNNNNNNIIKKDIVIAINIKITSNASTPLNKSKKNEVVIRVFFAHQQDFIHSFQFI